MRAVLPGINSTAYNGVTLQLSRENMPLSGEAIRLMNYIDDVSVTLRRVLALAPTLPAEERTLVSEHFLRSKPSVDDVMQVLQAK